MVATVGSLSVLSTASPCWWSWIITLHHSFNLDIIHPSPSWIGSACIGVMFTPYKSLKCCYTCKQDTISIARACPRNLRQPIKNSSISTAPPRCLVDCAGRLAWLHTEICVYIYIHNTILVVHKNIWKRSYQNREYTIQQLSQYFRNLGLPQNSWRYKCFFRCVLDTTCKCIQYVFSFYNHLDGGIWATKLLISSVMSHDSPFSIFFIYALVSLMALCKKHSFWI